MTQGAGVMGDNVRAIPTAPLSAALRVKRELKRLVGAAERILPEPIFDQLDAVAFPAYKAMVRAAYVARGGLAHAWRDRARWAMTRDVASVMPRTLVGIGGLEVTHRLARRMVATSVPGDFVELGVARGGCAALLGKALFDDPGASGGRKLWLFDSYEGLPDPGAQDFGPDGRTGDHVRPLLKGSCLGTIEDVREFLLGELHFPADRVIFAKGWFQDTVVVYRERVGRIAILRIDGDWYDSTKVCLEGLYDQVSRGGAVILDDYHSCYGARRATDEFLASRRLTVDLRFDGRGGCWFLKP